MEDSNKRFRKIGVKVTLVIDIAVFLGFSFLAIVGGDSSWLELGLIFVLGATAFMFIGGCLIILLEKLLKWMFR